MVSSPALLAELARLGIPCWLEKTVEKAVEKGAEEAIQERMVDQTIRACRGWRSRRRCNCLIRLAS